MNVWPHKAKAAHMLLEKLWLNQENSQLAVRAMASVLLLYYQLLRESGITSGQADHVNVEDFHPFKYLSVEVSSELEGIDQSLLREGAAVYLLCALNDLVAEYETNYLKQPLVQRILSALSSNLHCQVPEAVAITNMVAAGESTLNTQDFSLRLAGVYERYVVSRFRVLLASEASQVKRAN